MGDPKSSKAILTNGVAFASVFPVMGIYDGRFVGRVSGSMADLQLFWKAEDVTLITSTGETMRVKLQEPYLDEFAEADFTIVESLS